MNTFPETRESLLVLLGDASHREAWEHFVTIYQPVIFRLAKGRGLQDADAQDLSQQVLISVASAIGRWQKQDESIRFRHWLRRVTRNHIINALTRKPQDLAIGGTAFVQLLQETPADSALIETEIETEYRRELYLLAADRVRSDVAQETWQAFHQTTVLGKEIAEVASQLGKSVGTIYASRSRIMRRLREAVKHIEVQES